MAGLMIKDQPTSSLLTNFVCVVSTDSEISKHLVFLAFVNINLFLNF